MNHKRPRTPFRPECSNERMLKAIERTLKQAVADGLFEIVGERDGETLYRRKKLPKA